MDKVEQIRAFLVGIADADGVSTILARAIEKQILPYIDSLQEEQLTRSVTKTSDQEEPVSEDLENAAVEWFNSVKYKSDLSGTPINAFMAGAQWQKEQMMKDAVDGLVTFDYYGNDNKTYGCIVHNPICLDDVGIKDTDKVKIIIIKEE